MSDPTPVPSDKYIARRRNAVADAVGQLVNFGVFAALTVPSHRLGMHDMRYGCKVDDCLTISEFNGYVMVGLLIPVTFWLGQLAANLFRLHYFGDTFDEEATAEITRHRDRSVRFIIAYVVLYAAYAMFVRYAVPNL